MQVEVQIDTSKPGPMNDLYEDDQFKFISTDMFSKKPEKSNKSVRDQDDSKKSKSSSISLKQLQSEMYQDQEGQANLQRRPSQKSSLSKYLK